MKAKVYIIFLFVYLVGIQAFTQILPDSVPPVPEFIPSLEDSITGLAPIPEPADSLDPAVLTDSINLNEITLSKDSLDSPVDYNAADSMIYDISDQKIHLYGEAFVNYKTISLKADYIIYDWKTNIVTAEGLPDSTGRMSGFPEFQDGEQSFNAKRMRYNFQTRKGIIYDVKTEQNGVNILGERSKFVSGDPSDTTSNDIVYSKNSIFTTCTHDHPHFGIRSTKQKVIPDKMVIIGPSNLEIMGVPTPIWLPFGFFPISSGRRTGLLFPRDYEYSPQWGFGLREIGWFFPLGDHINLSVTGNIYLKGTWGLNARSQYRKRYKYNGNLSLGFDSRRSESLEGVVTWDRSFSLRWSHRQDASAHPTNTFGGTINFQTNNFQSRVFNDAASVLQNQLNSNFSFSKIWQNRPISLTASFNHSQNTASRNVSVNFPNLNFQTQTLYPFKRKKRVGKERWYETVTLRYSGDMRSQFQGSDTTFFSQETLDQAQLGIQHQVTTGTSFKLFKYFNLNPSASYNEVWNFNTLNKTFDSTIETDTTFLFNADSTEVFQQIDTLTFGTVKDNRVWGFSPFRRASFGVGLNTKIFGTLLFKKGLLRGIRHTVTPTISFSYTPDLSQDSFFDEVQRDIRFPDDPLEYSIFQGGIFGQPTTGGAAMSLNYSISNNFDAKYYSKKDSTEKKVKIFDRLLVGGSYNFLADSLKWSTVNATGATQLFKGMTLAAISAQFDPYVVNEDGRRINTTVWDQRRGLLRFVQANLRFNTNLTVKKIRALFQGKEEEVVEDVRDQEDIEGRPLGDDLLDPNRPSSGRQGRREFPKVEETDFLSLFENFSISHNLAMGWSKTSEQRDTFRITTHSLNFRGSIQLTENWAITLGNFGYDFVRQGLSYPFVGFRRDLHCWEMGMNWAPTRGTYNFYIQVKPGMLDFIRIPYDQNNADRFNPF